LNLEQQKKQARELLLALRAGNNAALARLRGQHLRWASVEDAGVRRDVALHDAQFVIAREQGFTSWTKLKTYSEPAQDVRHTRIFVADVQWITDRVHGLLRTRHSAGPAALEQIRIWHPRFDGCSDAEILEAPFTEADAQLVYAKEHGFDSWDELVQRVNLLASSSNPEVIEFVLRASGLDSIVQTAVSSEEVGRGKPAPDVYLEAVRRLGFDGSRCVAVEDSHNGIRSAKSAELRVIAIPNPHFPPDAESVALADIVLPSIDELTAAVVESLG